MFGGQERKSVTGKARLGVAAHDQLMASMFQRDVQPRGLQTPRVREQAHGAAARDLRLHQLAGPVRRAAVGDQHLDLAGKVLGPQRVEAVAEVGGRLVGR